MKQVLVVSIGDRIDVTHGRLKGEGGVVDRIVEKLDDSGQVTGWSLRFESDLTGRDRWVDAGRVEVASR